LNGKDVTSSFDPHALSLEERARMLRDLQRGRTSAKEEQTIAEVLFATRGEDLFRLKRLHDAAASYRDLVQLVLRDIDDAGLRSKIFDHFRDQAASIAAAGRKRKIVSDVDDTIYCNWKDARYPKKAIYPGVLAFYEALCPPSADDPKHADVTFLTARPRDRAGLVERLTHRTLRGLGIHGATVLSGALHKVLSNRGIAEGKLQNLLVYRDVYPECELVLVGDSGQGDVDLGLAALERAPDVVRAVFIHDVVDTPEDERASLRKRGVIFFDTYAGAAAEAAELGLLARDAARRVAEMAAVELGALRFATDAARARIRRLFERDARRVGVFVDDP
jgi:hypothetical protein